MAKEKTGTAKSRERTHFPLTSKLPKVYKSGDTPSRVKEALVIARQKGLLSGTRTELVRGRLPKSLVEKAKARTGLQSDTQLLEAAIATLAVEDDYPEWLLSQRGSVNKDLDLEL